MLFQFQVPVNVDLQSVYVLWRLISFNTAHTSNTIFVNSLPNDIILDWSKLEAFTDDKIKVAKIMIFVFERVENIVEKEDKSTTCGMLDRG